jgi:hypothetical protein
LLGYANESLLNLVPHHFNCKNPSDSLTQDELSSIHLYTMEWIGKEDDLNSNKLFIVDHGNKRIMSYLFGASSGTLVAGDTTAGSSRTQLNYPAGLYFDSLSNSLIIANHLCHNIVRWVLGATNWTLVAGDINCVSGNSSTELNYPRDVIFDPMGNLYLADRDNQRIQLLMVNQTVGMLMQPYLTLHGQSKLILNLIYT